MILSKPSVITTSFFPSDSIQFHTHHHQRNAMTFTPSSLTSTLNFLSHSIAQGHGMKRHFLDSLQSALAFITLNKLAFTSKLAILLISPVLQHIHENMGCSTDPCKVWLWKWPLYSSLLFPIFSTIVYPCKKLMQVISCKTLGWSTFSSAFVNSLRTISPRSLCSFAWRLLQRVPEDLWALSSLFILEQRTLTFWRMSFCF